jgi:hypothetical protein
MHVAHMVLEKPQSVLQVVDIPKVAAEDTTLSTKNNAGETVTVPIPAGTRIVIHTPGLHHNRRPHIFI